MTDLRHPRALLASAEFARAYTLASLTAVFGSFALTRLTSPRTMVTIVVMLALIGLAVLWSRREELSLLRLAPSSVLAFLAFALLSVAWTTDRSESIAGWAELIGWAVIAITVGHVRDTLQTVRAIGDALRWLLGLSLLLEIIVGVLLDTSLPLLGIEGDLALGGPVQGIFGTRNMLGFVAVIALITFVIEWRSQSVTPAVGMGSIALAAFLALLSASPTVVVLAAALGVASLALMIARHAPAARRRTVQWALSAVVVIGGFAAFALRSQIVRVLNAGSDFSMRTEHWRAILEFIEQKSLVGWGWVGDWPGTTFPYIYVNIIVDVDRDSALNAFVDVALQLGTIGLALFLLLGAVALVRSWLTASARRSVVYAWTPLVLVTLAVDSMFESFTLIGIGWFALVLCALRAGQSRSWREDIDAAHAEGAPPLPSE